MCFSQCAESEAVEVGMVQAGLLNAGRRQASGLAKGFKAALGDRNKS